MANKQLTASVRLNTTQFEAKLKRIARGIDALNNSVRRGQSAYHAVNEALRQSDTQTTKIKQKTDQWKRSAEGVTASTKQTNSVLSSIGSKLKSIASTYLGIMGAKAVIKTTDTLIGAQNRLNYVSANTLGDKAYNDDGTYSSATTNLTQSAMDKMYTSAQKVRTSYSEMMSNVSRNMTLAGKAFGNNVDNAIRFQEIMAEAYVIGGATAQEMSSSMYQLTQALGAGILAGDELRSVREGAPLAYQEIEKFAQKTLNSTESLKELASQGRVTSDIVVAAIMNAGETMDNVFKQTKVTFGQVGTMIKSSAERAFQPVMDLLSETLQRVVDNGLVQKCEALFTNISKSILIVFEVVSRAIEWTVDNWNWLKYVVCGVLLVIIALMAKTAVASIINAIASAIAWLKANWALLLIVAALMAILYCFEQVKNGAMSMTEFLLWCAVIISTAFLIAGIIMGSVPMMVIAGVLLLLAIIFMFFEEICYGASWLAAWIVNIGRFIWNAIISGIYLILTFFNNAIAIIVNTVMGVGSVISAVCQNIGIAFQNAWNGALSSFWNFIASCMEGLDWLAKPISAIAELFGKSFDYEDFTANIRAKADSYSAKQKDYVSLSDAWSSGWNTMKLASYGDALNSGMSTLSYVDANQWGSTAGNWGAGIKDSINGWGSQFQSSGSTNNGSLIDNLGESLGLDFSQFDTLFDPAGLNYDDVGTLLNNSGATADNTGKMADSMDLAEEDLEYLRKIAAMEWKKEFTTANITVDMSNYNTINGDGDLDGIVTKLSDKLREELNVVANGVYT